MISYKYLYFYVYFITFSDSKFLKDEAIEAIKAVKEEAHVFPDEVADFLHQLRREVKKHPNGIDFQNPERLSNEGYYNLTGLTKENFENLYLTCKDFLGIEKGAGMIIRAVQSTAF